jgi:hypothetical protein
MDITIEKLEAIQTLKELEELDIGILDINVGYRGGGLGFHNADIARVFDIDQSLLPNKVGAGCNYLGGGVRGSVYPSTFSEEIEKNKLDILNALSNACVRVYTNIETEDGLNNEVDDDGETNYDASATKAARDSGIESAY